jgi:hypothetical protein
MIKINKKTGLIIGISACIIIILFITLALTKQFPGQKSKSDKKPTSTTGQQNFKNYYDIENFEINVSDNVNYIITTEKAWQIATSIRNFGSEFVYGYSIIPMLPTTNVIRKSDTITKDSFNLYSNAMPLSALTAYKIKIQSYSFMINNLNSAITDTFINPLINIRIYDKKDTLCLELKETTNQIPLKTKVYNNYQSIMYYYDEYNVSQITSKCNIENAVFSFNTTNRNLNSTASDIPLLSQGQLANFEYYCVISLSGAFFEYLQNMINYSDCIISDITGTMAVKATTNFQSSDVAPRDWIPAGSSNPNPIHKKLIAPADIKNINITDLYPTIYSTTTLYNGPIYGYRFVPLSIKSNLLSSESVSKNFYLFSGPLRLSSNRNYRFLPNIFKFDTTNYSEPVSNNIINVNFYLLDIDATTTTTNNVTTTKYTIKSKTNAFDASSNTIFNLEQMICGKGATYTLSPSNANAMTKRTSNNNPPSNNILFCLIAEIDMSDSSWLFSPMDTCPTYICNPACSFIIEPLPLT